jgi:hypothetical protein
MGRALIGFLRGWVAIGFLTFLAFLLPLPESFYTAFEASFFGPAVAKTVPLIYEGTAKMHPENPNFMEKIENTLLLEQYEGNPGSGGVTPEKAQVYKALYQIERFFRTDINIL